MSQLLPCPFCGGEAKVYGPVGWHRAYGISHSCRVFYGGSGDFTIGGKSKAEAVTAWNTRAPAPPPADGGEGQNVTGEKPHRYDPEPMMNGVCRICGHTLEAHVGLDEPADGGDT